MYFCDLKEVTLSLHGENSPFRKTVTLIKLLFCEMNKKSFLLMNDYSKILLKVIFA